MTPEDIATALRSKECPGEPHGNKIGMFDGLAQDECWMCIADAIRAALRERDATWTKALHGLDVCGHSLFRYEGDDPKPIYSPKSSTCDWCRALRALLEEAGE